jgi:hypothetical protein
MITIKILFVALVISLTSCKKELAKLEGKTCWKCHVYGSPNPNFTPYDKTVCDKSDTPPQFHDDYGNDLNATCDKQ